MHRLVSLAKLSGSGGLVILMMACTSTTEVARQAPAVGTGAVPSTIAATRTPAASPIAATLPGDLRASTLVGRWQSNQLPCQDYPYGGLPFSLEFLPDGTYIYRELIRGPGRGGEYDEWKGAYALLEGNRLQLRDQIGTATNQVRVMGNELTLIQVDNQRRCAGLMRAGPTP